MTTINDENVSQIIAKLLTIILDEELARLKTNSCLIPWPVLDKQENDIDNFLKNIPDHPKQRLYDSLTGSILSYVPQEDCSSSDESSVLSEQCVKIIEKLIELEVNLFLIVRNYFIY